MATSITALTTISRLDVQEPLYRFQIEVRLDSSLITLEVAREHFRKLLSLNTGQDLLCQDTPPRHLLSTQQQETFM